jgi:hypothetical protein
LGYDNFGGHHRREILMPVPKRVQFVEIESRELAVLLSLAGVIREGYDYDPGSSDLDDEQPIHVRMTLGDYRKARRVVHS